MKNDTAIDFLELTVLKNDPGDDSNASSLWKRCKCLLTMANGYWTKDVMKGGMRTIKPQLGDYKSSDLYRT